MKRFLLLLSLLLLACEDESSENCPTPTSGAFTKVQLRGTITKDSINSLRADFGIEDKYEAIYDVSVVAVEYETLGPKGEAIIASGAVYIPIKEDNEPMSLISGQHGLTIKKYDVPSVIPSYGYFGFFGAAIGYAAIQPDYVGLGTSDYPFYPFGQKANGRALVDMADGMMTYACENDINLNDNFFVMGYSDGGYNSIAMHQEMTNNPRSFDIDASVVFAGFFNLERPAGLQFPDEIPNPAWTVFPIYVMDQVHNLGLMDKVIRSPYLEKLSNTFSGQYDRVAINSRLTTVTQDLFTSAFINDYDTSSIFDAYKQQLKDQSFKDVTISGDLLLIHSKEDEVVPYSESVNLHDALKASGQKVELQLLETGSHSPVEYAPGIISALDWLKQYDQD